MQETCSKGPRSEHLEHEELFEGGVPSSYKHAELCERAVLTTTRHDTTFASLKIVFLSIWYRFSLR